MLNNDFAKKQPVQHTIENPNVIEAIANAKEQPIVFFGASLYFQSFDKHLSDKGVAFVVADNDPAKQGKPFGKTPPVIAPHEIAEKYSDSYVCLSTNNEGYYEEMYTQLVDMGVSPKRILSFKEIIFNLEESSLTAIYNMLEDDESRMVFTNVFQFDFNEYMNGWKNNAGDTFEPYFDMNIIKLADDETFIDAGAYTGDTVEAFVRHTNNRFKMIHSFEPSKRNVVPLKEKYSDDERIAIHQLGLGNEKTSVSFTEREQGSQICASGEETIDIDKLDDVLGGERATFIKMDIEGAELEALRGAEQTIRTYKPKLAICVYHKAMDIIDIVTAVKNMVPEYRLFLRRYGRSQYEIVLYAIRVTSKSR